MSRTTSLCLVILFLVAPALIAQEDLVVHEWGTFTTVTTGDGSMLRWRPLQVASDLPDFVHRNKGGSKLDVIGTMRMETPVLYFHSEVERKVDLRIDFPEGRITEWYPQTSKSDEPERAFVWKDLEIIPGRGLSIPKQGSQGHYFAARAVPSAQLRIRVDEKTEQENFIFYRGVGSPGLPIGVEFRDDRFRVRNEDAKQRVPFIIFENDGRRTTYGVYGLQGEKNDLELERPLVERIGWDDLDHRGALKKLIIEAGLFESEADAMLATWKDDWFTPGLRIFWIVPRSYVDRILPLSVTPEPKRLERVFVGRVEVLTPSFEAQVKAAAKTLVETGEIRELIALGRFADPLVSRLLDRSSDHKVQAALARFRATLVEPQLEATVN